MGPLFAMITAAAGANVAVPVAQTGFYESRQPEVAAALELGPDGHFRYALDYGAVSEMAEGKWTSDGRTVFLTSDPMPNAPSFAVVSDEPAPAGQYVVLLEDPGFDWGGPLEFVATVDGGSAPVRIKPGDEGEVKGVTGRIATISPIVPVYDIVTQPIALSGPGGHKLTLRFERKDLGKARFVTQPLPIEDGGLRLDRYETTIRLVRAAPQR
jgi:hypothetical protein